jgi:hypothetical protein
MSLTTPWTVADCSTSAINIVGIATSAAPSAGPVAVVLEGVAQVQLDGAAGSVGDIICRSTINAGQGHDNTQTACAAGAWIGVVAALSGTATSMQASSAAALTATTTTPFVQLHIQ